MLTLISLVIALTFVCSERIQAGRSASEWKSRIIYQILTDRFATSYGGAPNCDLSNYCGGTYRGIINHLDYIQNLGMNAIYISPIVKNTDGSYHGYHATDFYSLNEHFGSESDLVELIDECHKRDIWVMVDTVFNHVGNVNGDYSRIIPFNSSDHYHPSCDIDYNNQDSIENCWIAGLPDLKQENSWVADELIRWINWLLQKYSFDGVRVDTVKHVPKSFWRRLVSSIGNVYLLGEVFNGDPNYLKGYTDIMKGQFSYPMYYTLQDVFAHHQSCYKIRDRLNEYQNKGIDNSLLGGFIDNHDNPRFLNVNKDWRAMQNALAYTLISSAIPVVYYGTEQGFTGGNDPQNREPLWNSGYNQNHELYKFVAAAASARKLIGTNEQHVERYVDDNFYAFSRGQVLCCLTNQGSGSSLSRRVTYLPFNNGDRVKDVFTGNTQTVNGGLDINIDNGMPQIWVKA